ncbi:porin family protein [Mucilaginibacter sp. PAMB04274]|uniref:porin family protein n=1 Tax=Mucilaginibacter sp. PAMB04274 TaxID=3138568 RepID=UPI0031F6464A
MFILAAGSFLTASAQSKSSIGIKGGINFASAKPYNGSITSFSAGIFINVKLSQAISLQPGTFYSGKGYKMGDRNEKINLGYIHIPVPFVYQQSAGPGKFFFGAGPFAAVAVSANRKRYGPTYYYDTTPGYYSSKITIGSNTNLADGSSDNIKRMDYGITGLAGYSLNNGLLFTVSYDLGVANTSYYNNVKTRVLGVSVGYYFK